MWQKDKQVSVIASDGTVVQPFVDPRCREFAPGRRPARKKAASDFLAITDRFPAIQDQVRAYVLVAERRWNLRLKNGIDIRLPETSRNGARNVMTLDRDKKLLSRDIAVIDLRIRRSLSRRLSDYVRRGAQEAMKDKKVKRKGDDA